MLSYLPESQKIVNTINNPGEEHERSSTVFLADGRYVIFWETDVIGAGNVLYARTYNADGTPVGPEVEVGDTVDNHASFYSAVALSDGGFALVWGHYDGARGSSDSIILQRYNSSGLPVGGASQVNENNFLYNNFPEIHSFADGKYIVVWNTGHGDGAVQTDGVYARLYNEDGTPAGDEFLVNHNELQDYILKEVKTFDDGSFAIVYQNRQEQFSSNPFDSKVFIKRYNADGSIAGSEFTIDVADGFNVPYDIKFLDDGGYMFARAELASTSSENDEAFFQLFNADGTPRTSEINFDQAWGNIALLPNNLFIMTWVDELGGALDDSDIFARGYDLDGVPQGNVFQVNDDNDVSDFYENVVALPDGKFMVTWSEYNINISTSDFFSPPEEADIVSRIFSLGGSLAPVAGKDNATVDEDSSVVIDVLANDSDPDDDQLAIVKTWKVEHGDVVINADGTLTYTPEGDYHGAESFYYQVTDGFGGYATQRVNVMINPVDDGVDGNAAPDANKDKFTVYSGQTVDLNILANDTDINGDILTVDRIWKTPENSNISVSLNGDNSVEFSVSEAFTPSVSYFMYYQISDGRGGIDVSSIEVNVINPDVNLFGTNSVLDEFLLDGFLSGNGRYNITDFKVADGDFLDIDNIISGYDPLSDDIAEFVKITDDGVDSILAVDIDGRADDFVDIAVLYDVIGLADEEALEGSGNLLVS